MWWRWQTLGNIDEKPLSADVIFEGWIVCVLRTSRMVKYVDIFPSSTVYAGSSYESLGRMSSDVKLAASSFSWEMDFLNLRDVFKLKVGRAKDNGTVINNPI